MEHTESACQLAASSLGWMPSDGLAPGRRSRERRNAVNQRRFLQPSTRPPAPARQRWRFMVRGHVQGVGYRAGCWRLATDLGLSGWVRNRPDGTVELEAEGNPTRLNDLLVWCEKGPAAAQVIGVSSARIPCAGDDWFEVRH